MNCCRQCEGIVCHFDSERAQEDLRTYREQVADMTTRMLVDALVSEGVAGMSLLDVGGGVGAIQHELLDAGANNAVAVEASAEYLDVDPACARKTRLDFLERYTDADVLILGAHFATPTAGYLVSHRSSRRFVPRKTSDLPGERAGQVACLLGKSAAYRRLERGTACAF